MNTIFYSNGNRFVQNILQLAIKLQDNRLNTTLIKFIIESTAKHSKTQQNMAKYGKIKAEQKEREKRDGE